MPEFDPETRLQGLCAAPCAKAFGTQPGFCHNPEGLGTLHSGTGFCFHHDPETERPHRPTAVYNAAGIEATGKQVAWRDAFLRPGPAYLNGHAAGRAAGYSDFHRSARENRVFWAEEIRTHLEEREMSLGEAKATLGAIARGIGVYWKAAPGEDKPTFDWAAYVDDGCPGLKDVRIVDGVAVPVFSDQLVALEKVLKLHGELKTPLLLQIEKMSDEELLKALEDDDADGGAAPAVGAPGGDPDGGEAPGDPA